jgi:hypothetical protein
VNGLAADTVQWSKGPQFVCTNLFANDFYSRTPHGRKFDVGDSVWVGIEIGSMPRLDQMRVHATLSDVDDGRISVGMPVRCTLDAHPDLEVPGQITEVTTVAREPHGQSRRRVFDVTVSLARSIPDTMLPGMSVRIEVALEETKDALLVPRAALDLSGETPRARLAGGRWKEISIGPCSAHPSSRISGTSRSP